MIPLGGLCSLYGTIQVTGKNLTKFTKKRSWKRYSLVQTNRRLAVSPVLFGVYVCVYMYMFGVYALVVKNPPAMRRNWVSSLGWEDPLEKGRATHSSILAWRIPWTVWSTGSQRVGHDWMTYISLKLQCLVPKSSRSAVFSESAQGMPVRCWSGNVTSYSNSQYFRGFMSLPNSFMFSFYYY